MKDLLSAVLVRSSQLLAGIGAFFALVMLLLISADVFSRMLFSQPLPGIIEIVSNWLMVGLVFLPLPLIEQMKAHIKVETFTARLAAARVRLIDRAVAVLTAAIFGALTYSGIEPALAATRLGETAYGTIVDLPVWPARWAIVLCCAGAMLIALKYAIRPEKGE